VRDPNRNIRLNSAIEVAANLVFIFWWVTSMGLQPVFDHSGVSITLTPEWRSFFFAILGLVIVSMIFATLNLIQPYWTRVRAYTRLGIDLAGSITWCWMFKAHLLAQIVAPNLTPERGAQVVSTINTAAAKCFPLMVLICVLTVGLGDVRRLIRMKPNAAQLAPKLAIVLVIAFLAWAFN
jgi:hypothetical protein